MDLKPVRSDMKQFQSDTFESRSNFKTIFQFQTTLPGLYKTAA